MVSDLVVDLTLDSLSELHHDVSLDLMPGTMFDFVSGLSPKSFSDLALNLAYC